MQYRVLGRTGIRVSAVGFGAWAIGGPSTLGEVQIGWGEVDDATSIRALGAAFDLGINFFDTADVYGAGHSEELIGKTFEGRRDRIIISSKVGNRVTPENEWLKDFSPGYITEAIDGSLARLRTDYVDIYHLHSPPAEFEYTDDVVDALESLKQQGKIRSYGVSLTPAGRGTTPADQGMAIIKTGKCDFFQMVYNILEREVEDVLLPACEEQNVGVIARVPLASGFLTGKFRSDVTFSENDHRHKKYPPERARDTVGKVEKLRFLTEGGKRTMAQAALQFCLAHPAVTAVIPGAKTPEQAGDNAAAADIEPLTAGDLSRIRETVASK